MSMILICYYRSYLGDGLFEYYNILRAYLSLHQHSGEMECVWSSQSLIKYILTLQRSSSCTSSTRKSQFRCGDYCWQV